MLGYCGVSDITSADQISFRTGPEFITELPNQWLLENTSGTPLGEAVVKADSALSTSNLKGTTAVLVMTDGEPNCETVNDALPPLIH